MSARKQVLRLPVENGRRKLMRNKMVRKTLSPVHVDPEPEMQMTCEHILFGSL